MAKLAPVSSLQPGLVLTRPDLGIRVRPSTPQTFTAWDLSASGGSTSSGSAALSLLMGISASGASSSSGSGAMALLMALAAQGASSSSGSGDLSEISPTIWALAGSGQGQSAGAGTLGLLLGLAAAGAARSSGSATALALISLGVALVAVLVPRPSGAYALNTPGSGEQVDYPIAELDPSVPVGVVHVAPDDLARFLRAVPGSQVQNPDEGEFWRLQRPFINPRKGNLTGG